MNYLLILLAVVLEFMHAGAAMRRVANWSLAWTSWLNWLCGRYRWWRGWLAAAVIVATPLLALAVGLHLLAGLAGWVAHLASLVVLVLMLGPQDLANELERHKRALAVAVHPDDTHAAFVTAARGTDLGAPSGDAEYDRTRVELAALALAADRAWFQPLLWFFVLGPLGALGYRLLENLRHYEDTDNSIAAALATLREAMECVPARITALTLGLAGTLVPVLENIAALGVARWSVSSEIVAQAALAAADHGRIREVISGDARIYRLNQMFALVKRALVAWLVLLAVAALLSA